MGAEPHCHPRQSHPAHAPLCSSGPGLSLALFLSQGPTAPPRHSAPMLPQAVTRHTSEPTVGELHTYARMLLGPQWAQWQLSRGVLLNLDVAAPSGRGRSRDADAEMVVQRGPHLPKFSPQVMAEPEFVPFPSDAKFCASSAVSSRTGHFPPASETHEGRGSEPGRR